MKILKNTLLYIWQLPQNLIGLLLVLWYKHEKEFRRIGTAHIYYTDEMPSGISLGDYIILNRCDMEDGIKHEYGHHRQSMMLGWLYLIIIGIPSLFGNIYDRVAHKDWPYVVSCRWYYSQPWEKWADELGGIDREAMISNL